MEPTELRWAPVLVLLKAEKNETQTVSVLIHNLSKIGRSLSVVCIGLVKSQQSKQTFKVRMSSES